MRWSLDRVWDWPLRLFLIRPFRCRDCRNRGYSFSQLSLVPSRKLLAAPEPQRQIAAAAGSAGGVGNMDAMDRAATLLTLRPSETRPWWEKTAR